MKPDIRPATLDDVPDLVELGADFLAASPYAQIAQIDGGVLANTLADMIESETALVLVATINNADGDRVVIGGIVGQLAPMWFSPKTLAAVELAWFVAENQRGIAGMLLAREFERWGRENGANVIAFSELRGPESHPWPVGDALASRGYAVAERSHIKGVS